MNKQVKSHFGTFGTRTSHIVAPGFPPPHPMKLPSKAPQEDRRWWLEYLDPWHPCRRSKRTPVYWFSPGQSKLSQILEEWTTKHNNSVFQIKNKHKHFKKEIETQRHSAPAPWPCSQRGRAALSVGTSSSNASCSVRCPGPRLKASNLSFKTAHSLCLTSLSSPGKSGSRQVCPHFVPSAIVCKSSEQNRKGSSKSHVYGFRVSAISIIFFFHKPLALLIPLYFPMNCWFLRKPMLGFCWEQLWIHRLTWEEMASLWHRAFLSMNRVLYSPFVQVFFYAFHYRNKYISANVWHGKFVQQEFMECIIQARPKLLHPMWIKFSIFPNHSHDFSSFASFTNGLWASFCISNN